MSIRISPDLERTARYNILGAVFSSVVTTLTVAQGEEPSLLSVGFAYSALLLSAETIIIAVYFIVTTLAEEHREKTAEKNRR
jgi:hypothetical protein